MVSQLKGTDWHGDVILRAGCFWGGFDITDSMNNWGQE